MPDIKSWLEARQIELVECLVPDFNGIGKGKTVPAAELFNGVIRLPEAIFGQDILSQIRISELISHFIGGRATGR